jgi:methionyl-tRNA formyltransferase
VEELKNRCEIVGIICTRAPKNFFSRLLNLFCLLKNQGLTKTAKVIARKMRGEKEKIFKYHYLEKYAQEHHIVNWQMPISDLCQRRQIDCLIVKDINSSEACDFLKKREVDILINGGGGIFREPIIKAVKLGILNKHMALLPDFRGMNVLEWSIFLDKKPGITFHFINQDIDQGDILLFEELPVEKGDTIASLRAKVQPLYIKKMIEIISLLKDDKLSRIKQKAEEGKQYFVMHPRLRAIVEKKLKTYC